MKWHAVNGAFPVARRYLRYARSKLCNVLTAAELQRRARDAGLPLTTASVSPGIVATNIWDNLPRFWRAPVRALVRRFCQTPRQARPSSWHRPFGWPFPDFFALHSLANGVPGLQICSSCLLKVHMACNSLIKSQAP